MPQMDSDPPGNYPGFPRRFGNRAARSCRDICGYNLDDAYALTRTTAEIESLPPPCGVRLLTWVRWIARFDCRLRFHILRPSWLDAFAPAVDPQNPSGK